MPLLSAGLRRRRDRSSWPGSYHASQRPGRAAFAAGAVPQDEARRRRPACAWSSWAAWGRHRENNCGPGVRLVSKYRNLSDEIGRYPDCDPRQHRATNAPALMGAGSAMRWPAALGPSSAGRARHRPGRGMGAARARENHTAIPRPAFSGGAGSPFFGSSRIRFRQTFTVAVRPISPDGGWSG